MSSDSVQTLTDPVIQSKMPLFDSTITSTGLTKSQNMSGFLGKQALQYSGSCLTYDPRGKDGAGFTPPWKSNSKTSLLDGRSPVTHLSGMERQNHIIYRQDSSSSEEGHSSSVRHAPVKQGFVLYAKSPGISNPTSAVRKETTKAGSEKSSSHSESPVYLAIPKPVYRHNPCCNELGCVIGQRYSVEHGAHRIPNTIYEHDWMQTEAHYADRLPVRRKAQDALLQQRGLHFDAGIEPLKRITVEAYSPGKARTLSAIMEPNYSSYPCTPTHTLLGSLSEHSQPLQTSPRGYPSLYSSQPTYEHMTSEVYQEHSLMPKYGQLAQHPMFYYPQANVEVENRAQCKDSGSKQREDVPVIHKHTISTPREHYMVPQPLHAEIPLPTTDMLPNHPFIQRFEYPCYAIQRFHLNANQIRSPLKSPHTSPSFHSSHINVSPPALPHPTASKTSLHKDKSSIGLQVNQLHSSSPFLHMDQISPTRRTSQPGVSPSSTQIGRFFSPLSSLHIDPSTPPPAGLNLNKLLDYSSCEAQVTCPKQPQSLPVSRAAWLPYSLKHSTARIHTAATSGANVRKIIYSPAAATGNKHNETVISPGNGVHKGSLKRSISHSSAPKIIKEEEDDDVYEVEVSKKPKREKVNESPPMPVIDTVFSLAPYHAYLQTSGVLIPGRALQTAYKNSEQHEIKPSMDIKKKRPDRDEEQPAVRLVSKEICLKDTPTEQTAVEPKNIKGEKVDTSDTDEAIETCVGENDCIKVTIKKEPEETDSPDSELVVLKVKCELDELENKPSLADEKKTSDESKRAALSVQMSSLSHGDAHTQHQQAVTIQPQTTAPPQPAESKVDYKNIPPQCLKLSTYNIIIPDIKHFNNPGPVLEKPAVLPVPEPTPKLEQMPVRKHFFELHHSLCKLVSKSVSASAEHELKDWLSKLQINEPVSPSNKVQKVSGLLGVKAREVWVNEEMKTALYQVLERLREYTTQERCPFPHVMRTGAVFLPMLVVKELLFPMVQGSFIDQVLQEHRVELRPTTLSEEKILIQLHKRACSSRLRRLMSLKHLPDVYADVVNLLYYTCVCEHLGLDTDDDYREQDGGCDASNSRGPPVFTEVAVSPDTPSYTKDQETHSHLNRNRTKSRVKSSSRRMFLDDSLSDEEEAGKADGSVLNTFTKKNWTVHEPQGTEDSGTDHMVAEQDSPIQQGLISEDSWMCPLSLNELSRSDTEAEESSSLWPVCQSSGPAKPQARSKNSSGMILKLRKMLSKGLDRKKAHYQAVSEFADDSLSQTDNGEGESSETDAAWRTPKVTHRWQRTGSFPHALRPLSSPSKRKNRSLLKIKYCPYLSACHSAEHRKRWVLRSAVQRARRNMRFYYPDLVGKRIHHLYEEDDKSEVWYRGEVLRIHKAHTNPLKTIFEVRYDSEPEWKYYLELLIDYKKGWLKIED